MAFCEECVEEVVEGSTSKMKLCTMVDVGRIRHEHPPAADSSIDVLRIATMHQMDKALIMNDALRRAMKPSSM